MRNPLQRRYGQGDLHFVTFSCVGRRPLLETADARDCFALQLDKIRTQYAFRLISYVVMPEHVHLFLTEPGKCDPSKALQVLKQRVSRKLLPKRRSGDKSSDERHFWQRRFYDFNVWSGKKITEKLEYMQLNPMKRGLVLHPKYWPWSSWSHYANGKEGLIAIDRWEEPVAGNLNPHP